MITIIALVVVGIFIYNLIGGFLMARKNDNLIRLKMKAAYNNADDLIKQILETYPEHEESLLEIKEVLLNIYANYCSRKPTIENSYLFHSEVNELVDTLERFIRTGKMMINKGEDK